MLIILILTLSVMIQAYAAWLAFKLIEITGRRRAWVCISFALFLMALRRAIPLYHLLSGDSGIAPDLVNEIVGVMLSILMAVGMAWIGPLFVERKKAEAELKEGHRRLDGIIKATNAGTWEWQVQTGAVVLNDRWAAITGYTLDELAPLSITTWNNLAHADDLLVSQELLERHFNGELDYYECELRAKHKDGHWIWVLDRGKVCVWSKDGKPQLMQGTRQDISEHKLLEQKLVTLAHYDALTSSPNRLLFMEKAGVGLTHAKRNGKQCAVLFIDLDHFKGVNDNLGHSAGDELLKDTAAKLAKCIRGTDVMARHGGDEFMVFLNDLQSGQDAQYFAERVHAQFNAPRMISGQELLITASIGIAVYPHDGDSLDMLARHADMAMYAAKQSGRNEFRFFDADMNQLAVTRAQIEKGLKKALAENEFAVFYQPMVSVSDGRVRGFEALLRWRKDDGEVVLPQDFISIAEKSGLIVPIGEWVMREACCFNQDLVASGYENMVVAVNISGAELWHKGLVNNIKQALDESGLRPDLLEIEVKESVFLESLESAAEIFKTIRGLGVRLSLDDFGTGHSSLASLQRLPVANLKIDRLCIKELGKGETINMVPAIIALAHKLRLTVVAEGVETTAQLEELSLHACDFYQGYLISYPLPREQVAAFLERARGMANAHKV